MRYVRRHRFQAAGGITCCLWLLFTCTPAQAQQSLDATAKSDAREEARKALMLDYEVALAAHASAEPQDAIVLWREIAARTPEATTPLANIALLQMKLGHHEEAEQSLVTAIARNPNAAYYNLLGIVQRHRGRFADARKSYEQALALDELYAKAHLNLAILCDLYMNELPVALDHYRRYQQLTDGKELAEVSSWIADIERRLKVAQ